MATKAELEETVAALEAQLADSPPSGLDAPGEPDERTVVQRILDIAREVGVLTPERSGGVPFAFRGIDATVAKLTPLLNRHGVFFAPTDVIQSLSQREAGKGKVLTKADVTVSYRAYGAAGDYIDFQVPAQADDFADRSSAQAMSVAFRILLLQVFHIAAFGNEEAASEATKSERESAGQSKVSAAQAAAQPEVNAAAQTVRDKIMDVAARKGMEPGDINAFIDGVTGGTVDDWWDDTALLAQALTELSKE